MTDLTLPGTIPGLLRRGSPVRMEWVIRNGSRFDARGHVYALPETGRALWFCAHPDIGCDNRAFDFLRLDLTDATGRAHAAWWLDATLRKVPPHLQSWTIPMYEGLSSAYPELLVHLDPAGPRALPDGTRWVDAEALRLVCLHVAGVTP